MSEEGRRRRMRAELNGAPFLSLFWKEWTTFQRQNERDASPPQRSSPSHSSKSRGKKVRARFVRAFFGRSREGREDGMPERQQLRYYTT